MLPRNDSVVLPKIQLTSLEIAKTMVQVIRQLDLPTAFTLCVQVPSFDYFDPPTLVTLDSSQCLRSRMTSLRPIEPVRMPAAMGARRQQP